MMRGSRNGSLLSPSQLKQTHSPSRAGLSDQGEEDISDMILLSKLHEQVDSIVRANIKMEGDKEYFKEEAVKLVQEKCKEFAPHEIEKIG